jgi:hypothetical protein
MFAKEMNAYRLATNALAKGNGAKVKGKVASTLIATHTTALAFQGVMSGYSLLMTAGLSAAGLSDKKVENQIDEEIGKMAGAAILASHKDIPIIGPVVNAARVGLTNLILNTEENAFAFSYIPWEVSGRALEAYNDVIAAISKKPGEGVSMKEILGITGDAGFAAVAVKGQVGRLPWRRLNDFLKFELLPQPEYKHPVIEEAKPRRRSRDKSARVPGLSDMFPNEYQALEEAGDRITGVFGNDSLDDE